MDQDNPFALSDEFTALLRSVQERAQQARAAAPDPLAAARAAALKEFSGLTDEQREAVIARLRAARKGP